MENLPPHIKKMQKTVEVADAKFAEETKVPGEGDKVTEKTPPVLVKTEEKTPEKPPIQADADQKKDEAKEVKPSEKTKKKQPFEEDTAEAWKSRFISLQGKYNNEVPSLHAQVKNATNELIQARSLIGDLQNKLENQEKTAQSIQPAKIDIPEDLSSLLSAEDVTYLSEEGIDQKSVNIIGKMVEKLSAATAQPAAPQQLTSELEDLKRDARDIKQNRMAEYEKKFKDAVPDWKEIDSSDAFNFDFLHQTIPWTDTTWKVALDRAQDRMDADKVIAILNKFKEMQGKEESAPYQINPEELVEPSSTVNTKVEAEPHEKTWTLAEAQKVYNDFKDGKIDQKEFDKFEAQIWKANNEGRIKKT